MAGEDGEEAAAKRGQKLQIAVLAAHEVPVGGPSPAKAAAR